MGYSFLEHTADVKFRAEGESFEKMLVSAAGALNETIRGNIKILELSEKSFEVEGEDLQSLLYGFLEEILILLEKDGFLVANIKEIEVEPASLEEEGVRDKEKGGSVIRCVVVGDKEDNYKFTNDVKAVTYSEMFVREKEGGDGWECQVVLDC